MDGEVGPGVSGPDYDAYFTDIAAGGTGEGILGEGVFDKSEISQAKLYAQVYNAYFNSPQLPGPVLEEIIGQLAAEYTEEQAYAKETEKKFRQALDKQTPALTSSEKEVAMKALRDGKEIPGFAKSTYKTVVEGMREEFGLSADWTPKMNLNGEITAGELIEDFIAGLPPELQEGFRAEMLKPESERDPFINVLVAALSDKAAFFTSLIQTNNITKANPPATDYTTVFYANSVKTLENVVGQMKKDFEALNPNDPDYGSFSSFLKKIMSLLQKLKTSLYKIEFDGRKDSIKLAKLIEETAVWKKDLVDRKLRKMRKKKRKMGIARKLMKIAMIIMMVVAFLPPTPINLLIGLAGVAIMVSDSETGWLSEDVVGGLGEIGEAMGMPEDVAQIVMILILVAAVFLGARSAGKSAVAGSMKESAVKVGSKVAYGTLAYGAMASGAATGTMGKIIAGITGEDEDSMLVQILAIVALLVLAIVAGRVANSRSTAGQTKVAGGLTKGQEKQFARAATVIATGAGGAQIAGLVFQYESTKLDAQMKKNEAVMSLITDFMKRIEEAMAGLSEDTSAFDFATELTEFAEKTVTRFEDIGTKLANAA